MNKRMLLLPLLCTAGLVACERDYMSEVGFSLPAGDPAAGQEAFVYMQCNECHTVQGVDLPRVPLADPPFVQLGGNVTKVKTYGDLVTSIINPSHKLAKGYPVEEISVDGESIMRNYNHVMTVQELIDIVMFLQPHYDVVIPYHAYPTYH